MVSFMTAKTTSSKKAKGRKLCSFVKELILNVFNNLEDEDVRITSSGANGEDVLLSPRARKLFPFSLECKSYASFSVYKHFKQACDNAGKHTPLLVIKANRKEPLVILSLDNFMELVKELSYNEVNESKDKNKQ